MLFLAGHTRYARRRFRSLRPSARASGARRAPRGRGADHGFAVLQSLGPHARARCGGARRRRARVCRPGGARVSRRRRARCSRDDAARNWRRLRPSRARCARRARGERGPGALRARRRPADDRLHPAVSARSPRRRRVALRRADWVDLSEIAPRPRSPSLRPRTRSSRRTAASTSRRSRTRSRTSAAGERLRGASTLCQQVAKNLFLWHGRSFVRKALEAWLTVWIELLWPKRRILEVYLNVVELGRGVFGVEAASRRYFGKPAAQLDAAEAALLAAVLPNPIRYHVGAPSPWVRKRAAQILGQMNRLGHRLPASRFGGKLADHERPLAARVPPRPAEAGAVAQRARARLRRRSRATLPLSVPTRLRCARLPELRAPRARASSRSASRRCTRRHRGCGALAPAARRFPRRRRRRRLRRCGASGRCARTSAMPARCSPRSPSIIRTSRTGICRSRHDPAHQGQGAARRSSGAGSRAPTRRACPRTSSRRRRRTCRSTSATASRSSARS